MYISTECTMYNNQMNDTIILCLSLGNHCMLACRSLINYNMSFMITKHSTLNAQLQRRNLLNCFSFLFCYSIRCYSKVFQYFILFSLHSFILIWIKLNDRRPKWIVSIQSTGLFSHFLAQSFQTIRNNDIEESFSAFFLARIWLILLLLIKNTLRLPLILT